MRLDRGEIANAMTLMRLDTPLMRLNGSLMRPDRALMRLHGSLMRLDTVLMRLHMTEIAMVAGEIESAGRSMGTVAAGIAGARSEIPAAHSETGRAMGERRLAVSRMAVMANWSLPCGRISGS